MKKNLLLFIFACFTLSTMAQEDVIRVNYKGAKPTITDFAWAYLFSDDEDECDQEATAGQKHALVPFFNIRAVRLPRHLTKCFFQD